MVKNGSRLKKVLFFISLAISLNSFSQRNLVENGSEELLLFEKFQEGLYNAVIQSLESKQAITDPSHHAMLLLSKLKTGSEVTKKLDEWIQLNPNHPYEGLVKFSYIERSFYDGDSSSVKKYLYGIEKKELTQKDKGTFGFISGIDALQNKQYKKAKVAFDYSLKNGFNKTEKLTYYQSVTNYYLGDYESAVKGFEVAVNEPDFTTSSAYYLAKIKLEQQEYDEVINLAEEYLSDEVSWINSGFFQLVGEAYAAKDNVAKADAYFKKAIDVHPGRPTAGLYYRAGISKFKLGNKGQAIKYFKEAGLSSGPYATLSAFQLGRLYIQNNETADALASYIIALSSDDEEIKEESIYQSTKLNIGLEQYAEAINYSIDYLRNFPSGKWVDEIQSLQAQCFLKTSDYSNAINVLETSGLRNTKQQEVYQQLTYQKAIQSFNDNDLESSKEWFDKSLRYTHNDGLSNEANYYLGEIALRDEKYQEAINYYLTMNPVLPKASYGIGYSLYNQRRYRDAARHFQEGIKSSDRAIKEDAKLRLADCYLAIKQYNTALQLYGQLPQYDYVNYQQAMAYRYLNQIETAIQELESIPTSSIYKDDALYWIAQIHFENAQFMKAESGYSSLIARFPNSTYSTDAYLNRGLAKSDLGDNYGAIQDYDKAIEINPKYAKAYVNRALARSNLSKIEGAQDDFVFVIENSEIKQEVLSAILGLQDLQAKWEQIGNLDKYISDYKKAYPEDGSIQVVEFESAKSIYFDQQYGRVIPKIKSYLDEYPQSKFRAEATYYLGESYFRSNQLIEAKEVFAGLLFLRNSYTSPVINRLGQIHTELREYDKAIEVYQLLLDLNLSEKDNFNAVSGLMNASFLSAHYTQAIEYANRVIASPWKPLNAEKKSRLIKAKSLLETGQKEAGVALVDSLALDEGLIAAEAAFISARVEFIDGNYEISLEKLFDLNARFGSYTVWIEKSFLLIADNYLALNELFQAKATLQSILQHSQNVETIRLATKKLQILEPNNLSDSTKEETK